MATLFVVATPIGNLEDVSERTARILREVGLVVSEVPATTKKLLSHIESAVPLVPYYVGGKHFNKKAVLDALAAGSNVALVSEAGTPGINDPGGQLVYVVRAAGFTVSGIPGPNAAVTAASVAGFPVDQFIFMGFVPHKKGRQTYFAAAAAEQKVVIMYESPHRVRKTLEALNELAPDRVLLVARELTKLHEQVLVDSVAGIARLSEEQLPSRGEFVLILAPVSFALQDKVDA